MIVEALYLDLEELKLSGWSFSPNNHWRAKTTLLLKEKQICSDCRQFCFSFVFFFSQSSICAVYNLKERSIALSWEKLPSPVLWIFYWIWLMLDQKMKKKKKRKNEKWKMKKWGKNETCQPSYYQMINAFLHNQLTIWVNQRSKDVTWTQVTAKTWIAYGISHLACE